MALRRLLRLALGALLLAAARPASAQEPPPAEPPRYDAQGRPIAPPPEPPKPADVTFPELIEGAQPVYSDEAKKAGI